MEERLNAQRAIAMGQGDDCLLETIEMTRRMIELAEKGDAESKDDGCAVLYGVVRDCAYRIRTEAERERTAHKATGGWEDQE